MLKETLNDINGEGDYLYNEMAVNLKRCACAWGRTSVWFYLTTEWLLTDVMTLNESRRDDRAPKPTGDRGSKDRRVTDEFN